MLKILRDSIWQFVFGFLALVVTVGLFFFFQYQRKELSYEITATPLLSVGEEVRDRLRISFDNRPVEDATLVLVRLFNSGNTPIARSDFDTNLAIAFGDSAEILDWEILSVVPIDLSPVITATSTRITLQPLLLNGGDEVVVKAILTGYAAEPVIQARVSGVKEATRFDSKTVSNIRLGVIVIISFVSGYLIPTQLEKLIGFIVSFRKKNNADGLKGGS